MSDESNIVRLAAVNNHVETRGEAAGKLVVQFLRDWADAIESGSETAEKAVLVLYDEEPGGNLFRVRTRRCNVKLVEQLGIMHMAIADLCTDTTK